MNVAGTAGTFFAVWAPNAAEVSVTGDFNEWSTTSHRLHARQDESGIWEGLVPGVGPGACYKYHVVSHHNHYTVDKADPFAFFSELPPRTASRVWDLGYGWRDHQYHEGVPMMLAEKDYDAALKAAERPPKGERDYRPHRPALSKHAAIVKAGKAKEE